MNKIGLKSLATTISKWENSFFGGFNRLIVDYPSIEIDMNVDFDFASVGYYFSYFEKEKIMKIFLSKAKTHGLIDPLLKSAQSVSETNFLGNKIIKTTINKDSQKLVLSSLIKKGNEYSPLFSHYKKFILETCIFFQQPDDSDKQKDQESGKDKKSGEGGNEKGDNDKKEKREDESAGKKNSDHRNADSNNEENEDGNNEDEKDKKTQERNNKNSDEPKNEESNKIPTEKRYYNIRQFKKSLNNIKEEKIEFETVGNFKRKTQIKIQKSNNIETKYDHEEINIADNLTKMLDISFDPTEDIVKNLRLGKLDITKIAEVPAGNIAIYKQTVENQTTKPFSVVILCDESGSMDGPKLMSQYHIVKSLYKSFSDILPQDKIFVYGHSGNRNPELYVYHDLYNQNFLTTIDKMLERQLYENYDGPIIEEVYKNVRAATSDRIIFIVLSDGAPCGDNYGTEEDFDDMKKIIEKCKRDEFVTVGVGIQAHHVKNLYQYSTIINYMNDMPKKVSHIVNHVVKTEFQ